jgi:HTH-type transcriptional regulator/antitoxin HigA
MTVRALEKKLQPFEEPLKSELLKWLYLHLPPQPIARKKVHHAYAEAISILMRELQEGSLDPSNREAVKRYLDAVITFIEDFEKETLSIGTVTPEEMLRFLMEQNQLTQYDLAREVGGQSVVSNILRGKRRLTREHIERLSRRFHIRPATFYS